MAAAAAAGYFSANRPLSGAAESNCSWWEYKNGFPCLQVFMWCGVTANLPQTLNDGRQYELRVDMINWESEQRNRKYSSFNVAPESNHYRIYVIVGGDSFRRICV